MSKTFVDRPKHTVVMLGSNDSSNSELSFDASWFEQQAKSMTTEELTSVIDSLTETRTRKIFGV